MKRGSVLAALVVILLLAAVLRFHRIEEQSFWNDEGNSARLSERSLKLIVEGTASDVHPPLYYLLLRGWRELAGESEFGLRAFSAFLGIGIVVLTYTLGRQLLGQRGSIAAVCGAFLAAVNPALIYYSQETRMYELLAFLAVLSSLLLVRLLQAKRWQLTIAIGYVGVSLAGLYTHYFFPAVLLAHNLIFLIWFIRRHRAHIEFSASDSGRAEKEMPRSAEAEPIEDRNQPANKKSPKRQMWLDGRNWLIMMGVLILLYLPWLPILLRQTGGRSGLRPSLPTFLFESAQWTTFGPTSDPESSLLPLLAYALLLTIGLIAGRKVGRGDVLFSSTLLLLMAAPVLLMWLLGATRPAYYKFMLVVVPALCLSAGAGWWWSWQGRDTVLPLIPRRLSISLLGILILWGTADSLTNMVFDPAYARADYRSIVDRIAIDNEPGAAVILNAANQWEVFTYYHKEGAPVFPIPRGYPNPAAIEAELAEIIARHDRIYVVFWGESERDPERLVERWLDAQAFKASEEWVGDVRFVTYAVAGNGTAAMETPVTAQFGDHIRLLGYTMSDAKINPGDILQLSLFWQTDVSLDQRYKVFLHLVDSQGQIVTQRDSEPGGGLALTSTWSPNETMVDNHGLLIPPQLPAGQYELLLGLYDLTDPAARLFVQTAAGTADTMSIGKITVSSP